MAENLPVMKPVVNVGAVTGGLVPSDFEGLFRMSQVLSASGLMPKGLEKPEAVFVAIQMGLEVGLSPMQAVQNIAVINGRPSIWGDSVLALVRASGLLESFTETIEGDGDKMVAIAKAKRKGEPDLIIRRFSVDDARRADLWGKAGPWKQYPKRMLQMRARSWALRDGFGDVLKGLRMAEEVMDFDVDMKAGSDGTYSIPEPAFDPFSNETFDKAVNGKNGDRESVAEFVAAMASHFKTTEADVVESAVADFAKFWKSFLTWCRKHGKPVTEGPEVGPGRAAWLACEQVEPGICADLLAGLAAQPSDDLEWGALAETAKAKIDEGNA